MVSELRSAARRLLQDRWFAGAAVLVAALGTGLNTAVFIVAYGVLVRPLPYRDASRLAILDVSVPLERIDTWREQLSAFEQITGYTTSGSTVRGLTGPRFVPVAAVDDAFFPTLGTSALVGRSFGPGDLAVAVLSERAARQAGVPVESLLGRSITVGEVAATVIGVMPAAFALPSQGTDVWIPARSARAVAFDGSPDERRFRLMGRLRRGVTVAEASDSIRDARRIFDPDFKNSSPERMPVVSLKDAIVGPAQPVLLVFAASAVIVLLVASANVAVILIGRTIARRQELAIRSALGATRPRLFMTIFAESVLIAFAGAWLGAGLATGAVRLVTAWGAGILPRLTDVRVDWPVLGVALALAAVASVLAAAPGLRALAPDPLTARPGVTNRPAAGRVRRLLAIAQIALAVLLLGAGGMLARTIFALLRADIGVEPRGVVVSQLILTESMNFDAISEHQRLEQVLRRVRAIPAASAAGAGSSLPPDNAPLAMTARIQFGAGTAAIQTPEMSLTSVTPGYLEALGTRLLHGRYFDETDDRRSDLVVVLSESAARILLKDVNPIGRQIPIELPGMRGRGHATVLGVVADVKYSGMESAPGPAIYVLWKELPAGQLYLAVRREGDVRALVPAVHTAVREADPLMPIMPIRRLDDVVQRSVADRRLRALLGGGVAVLALAIALVGLAGGLGRIVAERRHELAVRAALGASPAQTVRAVMADGAIIASAGIVVGTLATVAAGGVLRSLVLGISPHDPATLALVAVLVALGSLFACYLPARRAATADPLEVLRSN